MKQFFSFFSGRRRLLFFTERLSELLSSGISLQKSLGILETLPCSDPEFTCSCVTLKEYVSGGSAFSAAIRLLPSLPAPDWYIAYISVAEECACIVPVLEHLLHLLRREKENTEKLIAALCYPLFILLLTGCAGFFSVFYFLPGMLPLFGEKAASIRNEALYVMMRADCMLVLAFMLLAICARNCFRMDPCIAVFRTMAFLTEQAVPTLSAVSCAFAFCARDKKISAALLAVRSELLEGERISACFGRCFQKSGFKKEGFLLSEHLSLCEETGRKNGFEKTADYIAAKKTGAEKVFLAVLQPSLLALSSLYITLILKTAFLPYITQLGDLI
ncbi:MAG: type II secretion system F family protein [Treponema sp.]|nr:type II secretion system F family protein [Treponema sp.]